MKNIIKFVNSPTGKTVLVIFSALHLCASIAVYFAVNTLLNN